jgi:hypothetical protein
MSGKILIAFLLALVTRCSNIGFVEKAKAVGSGEFGFDVIMMGGASTAGGSFLAVLTPDFYSSCASLAGITKANCLCQAEATNRQSSGTYRAWLSISGTVDAICNIQGLSGTSCSADSSLGPFFLRSTSGFTVLAESYSELSSTGFRAQLETTGRTLYTGTGINGRATGQDCSGFESVAGTGTAGSSSQSGSGFTSGQNLACGTNASFICMRQSK